MAETDLYKTYLDSLRSAILWKLEGLAEWQLRWPLTATGTNLLGLIKHLATMEYGYLGLVFDRAPADELPWMANDAEPNADMWAGSDESVADVLLLYRRAVEHANATIDALDADATGRVPWWPEPEVTLRRVLVHLCVEVARHAGQIDILREQLDGRVGMREANINMPFADDALWADHCDKLREIAVRSQWAGASVGEYAFPGPLRDKLVAAILSGEKTATASLLEGYRCTGDAVPAVGEVEVVIDSRGLPVCLTRTTDVRIVDFDEVDLDHALAEGEGFANVEQWREGHLKFWSSPEVRAEFDDPEFRVEDSTKIVLQSLEVIDVL